MTVRYTYLTEDGTPLADGTSLTPPQCAFQVLCEGGIGIPVLDRSTIDEFTRRADLIQTYMGTIWRNGDGTPRIFGRADWMSLLPGARSNWTKVSRTDFDRNMNKEIEAYWKHLDEKARKSADIPY